MYYVYVLQNIPKNRHYIGNTEDVNKRLAQHNQGKVRSTKGYRPWKIIYTEVYDTKTEARKREIFFKKTAKARQEIFSKVKID